MRWRHGRTITTGGGAQRHYPSVINPRAKEISARFLSEDERVHLGDLRRQGAGVRAIARELGRSPSTISRELRRNGGESAGRYRPFAAHRLAAERRARPGRGKLIRDPVLREFVQDQLKKKWSPEQICQGLRREFPHEPERHLVPETIYQSVYRPELGGLCRELPAVLRRGRRRRRSHRRADARRAGGLVNMRMLDQRPAEAADRALPGHWEGDLIVGSDNRSAIGTVVERASRFTMLLHLPDGRHTAEAVRDALLHAMQALPAGLRRSLAWDQGREMALHAEVAAALDMAVFFCDPHSPGSEAPTRTPTGCCVSTSPRAATFASTPRPSW